MHKLLSRLPKVDQLLEEPALHSLLSHVPRRVLLRAIRETLDGLRRDILSQGESFPMEGLDPPSIVARIAGKAEQLNRPNFRRVVNGTGVIIHTNLGRSLMAEAAVAALVKAAGHYSNLEYNLEGGQRGTRYSHVEDLLCELTGAEAGLVVNNNAAAVLISLDTLARGRQVIVSRGELVEIGGAFRIPEVMARSGAILVEVGTTNKTHLRDYEGAINEETALVMKVHQSNFRIIGFTEQVEVKEVTALAHGRGLPVLEDLGSGSLVDLSVFGLRKEPTVGEAVASGVDVTTFSGDKLLGGPQAGIIVGRREMIDRIKKNPLNRALRIDKFTLASLEATLRLYLDDRQALEGIPTLRMIAASYPVLRRRAAGLKRLLLRRVGLGLEIGLADGYSTIGGGALPEQGLRTRLVTVRPLTMSVNRLEERLRSQSIPVIGRIENDLFVLDVRTLVDDDFAVVALALAEAAGGEQQ
jgi:L-seryl-tRNA(Ser) seleniumtransferase